MAQSVPSIDNPLRMSAEGFRARQEAGEAAIVAGRPRPEGLGAEQREDPWRPAGLSRTPDRSALAQGSPDPGLLNLTAGSDQRPCGAPAPRTGLHGSLCPARWFRCMAIGRFSGGTEGVPRTRREQPMISADVSRATTPTDARGARLARGLPASQPARRAGPCADRAIESDLGPDLPTQLTASLGGPVRHLILPSPGAVMRADR
jgi:hypothetical protein